MSHPERMAERYRWRARWSLVAGCGGSLALVALAAGALAVAEADARWRGAAVVGGGLLLLVGLAALVFGMARADAEGQTARRYARGARAETRVRALLDALPADRWAVAHNLPTPFGDLDHVLIGADGRIIVLETKASRGVVEASADGGILVNGRPPERPWEQQAQRAAGWVRAQILRAHGLRLTVTPVIVCPWATVISAGDRVLAFDADGLAAYLEGPSVPLRGAAQVWAQREGLLATLATAGARGAPDQG